MILSFIVDLLLLISAGSLYGHPVGMLRLLSAAVFSSLYTGLCLQPGCYFLGNLFWRMIFLLVTAIIAYGVYGSGLRRGVIFIVLYFALGRAVLEIGTGGTAGILWVAGVVGVMCCCGAGLPPENTQLIPVELIYGDKKLNLTALKDTGNTLRDPITGQRVLVVGGDVAGELIGLTREQLKRPIDSIDAVSGLRLIPYHTVDRSNGFLLAMKFYNARIGTWRGSTVVAFAPEVLNEEGIYQALTGGTV